MTRTRLIALLAFSFVLVTTVPLGSSQSPSVKVKTVWKMKKPKQLAKVARTANDAEARRAAVDRISQQNVLTEVAENDSEWTVRQAAAARITDQETLVTISKNDVDIHVRITAMARISDLLMGQRGCSTSSEGLAQWQRSQSVRVEPELWFGAELRPRNRGEVERAYREIPAEYAQALGYAATSGSPGATATMEILAFGMPKGDYYDGEAHRWSGAWSTGMVRLLVNGNCVYSHQLAYDIVTPAKIRAAEYMEPADAPIPAAMEYALMDAMIHFAQDTRGDYGLAKLAVAANSGNLAGVEAVNLLTNQALLLEIVRKAADAEVRKAALSKLNDTALIAELATRDADPNVRQVAASKLNDQKLLTRIAKDDRTPDVRAAAAERLTNQAELKDIAWFDRDPRVRAKVVVHLTDSHVLDEISRVDSSTDVRQAAAVRMAQLRSGKLKM